jgi:hypothetical protein
MLLPENQNKKYDHLFADIDTGYTKIPKFQRDFVWSKVQTSKLIDSIIKGFPIGTFIFWKTREELRHVKNIGNAELPSQKAGESVAYVLDGQQRITSLFAVKKGLIITKEGKEIDYKDISIDLSLNPDDEEEVVSSDPIEGSSCISVYQLLNGSLVELIDKYSKDDIGKIGIYQKRLTTYDFSTILIDEYPIDIACEIFTRINTGGMELTLFEIMVAKTYDQERGFDLADEYEMLIDNGDHEKDLKDAGYETIPTSTILQCIAACLIQDVRRKSILKLDKSDVIEIWPNVKDSIFHAIDFFSSQYRIPVSRLLPYPGLLVPFTYFFFNNNGNPPTSIQNKLLLQYFWWVSLLRRFSSGVESKLAQDFKRIDDILEGNAPSYQGEEIELTLDGVINRPFSTGDSFCKAILTLYAYHVPRSFSDNSLVKIDNSWLKVAFSKNYHHFFPKNYLKRNGFTEYEANSIVNITIVDDYLNKRAIGAKAPSNYMNTFKKDNDDLVKTMKTHLIDDLDDFGIWNDDYKAFLDKRGKKILRELKKRLNPKI